MPRSPAWTKNINEIKARAESYPKFAFDRAAVAELFNVSQRQAANLLEEMAAEKHGGAFLVPHARLIAFLDGIAVEDLGVKELERREALALKLAKIRAAGPPLRAIRAALAQQNSFLPTGVTVIGPGELKITYDSPGTVLGIILALAELSEMNSAAFADSLEYHPPEGEEDE